MNIEDLKREYPETFIEKFADRVNWSCISKYQKLSESFIEKFADKVDWDTIKISQKLSDAFVKKFNIQDYNLLNITHNCGQYNRTIFILKDRPKIIHIGCFSGTREEAFARISEAYVGSFASEYIAKVEACFNFSEQCN